MGSAATPNAHTNHETRTRRRPAWTVRARSLALGALSASALATGCGIVDMPMWINIDPANSGGVLGVGGNDIALDFSGGFYTYMVVDTSNLLTSGVSGTVEVPVVRMAAQPAPAWQPLIGTICMYNDPAVPLVGDIYFDVLSGESDFGLPLAVKAWSTALGPSLGAFDFAFPTGGEGAPPLDLQMDTGILIDAIAFDGDIKDAIAIPIDLDAALEVPILGLVDFAVTLDLASDNVPSDLDPDVLDACADIIQAQVGAIPYHVQPRSTFLRTSLDGDVRTPAIIDLAQLGAEPGDTLRFSRSGYYGIGLGATQSWGNAVFSASNALLPHTGYRYRVPDAIDAGEDYLTPWVTIFPTDIGEDFGVLGDDPIDVVVPAGATHLFLGAVDTYYADNSGLTFTVWIENVQTPPVLVNGDMEDVTDVFDDGIGWEQDAFTIVGAENGVTPRQGASMLRFDATDGPNPASIGSNVAQRVDVGSHAGTIDVGQATFGVSAFFNRVFVDASTDTLFLTTMRLFDAADQELDFQFAALPTDDDPTTWQEAIQEIWLPPGTRSVQLEIVAFENRANDAVSPEFDGHYADDVTVWIGAPLP